MQNLKALTGQIAVWASAFCEGDDLVAKADSETVSVLSKGVDSDLGTYSNLGRRVTLQSPGPNRMQSLSTEKACKCFMRLDEATARRTVFLRNSSFKPTDVKGPNGGYERALNPLPGPRAETKVDMGGVVFFTERLPALWGTNAAMAAT